MAKTNKQETTTTRQERLDRRKNIINALIHPFWQPFKLVELALESEEPIIVDLDFAATRFPGRYIHQIVDMLQDLQSVGLVQISKDRSGQTAFEMCIAENDEVARALIETLYQ